MFIRRFAAWPVASIIAALPFFAATPGLARDPAADANLVGLTSLGFLAEDVPDNSCGLTRDDVTVAVRFALIGSRIKIDPSPTSPDYIYARVTTLGDCSAASVELSVNARAHVQTTQKVVSGARVWDTGGVLGGSADMRQRVIAALDTATKTLVTAWSAQNPSNGPATDSRR